MDDLGWTEKGTRNYLRGKFNLAKYYIRTDDVDMTYPAEKF